MDKPKNDSDANAWLFYEKYYGKSLSYEDKKYTVGNTKILVNGDVCFNVKLKYDKRFTMLGSIIKKEPEPQFNKLNELLSELLYSPMNISILPKTGGLNIIKKNFADDRFDSFVWLISKYYEGVTAPIVNRGTQNAYICNQLSLQEFLDEMDDENRFCLTFYGIPKEFVSKLIDSGKSAIRTYKEFYNFLLLATEFWEIRLKNFIQIIYVFLTIFLYLLKCPQSLILSALRAFCFCGKPHISRSIFLYFLYQTWLKSW